MIPYIENPEDSIRKLLELISEARKVMGYNVNTQKSLALHILTMKNQKEKLRKQFHSLCNEKNKILRNKST